MKVLVLMIASALGVGAPALAQTADVTGAWELTIATAQTPAPVPMVLKKDGDKIVGTLTGPQGEMPVEVTVKDKAVTIGFSVQTQNGVRAFTLAGTIDGDAMKGTVDFGRGPADWSAKRTTASSSEKPAASGTTASRIDVTGTWAVEVVMDAGSGSPTFVFKQDGEKLTGRYSGQLGEAPVTGTIKGGAIEFALDADVQGTALHIVYSGVADNGAMKGTVKFGDFGNGTFTGKKK
jgi:hypothetical protein